MNFDCMFILPLFIGLILGSICIKFNIFKINYFNNSIANYILTLLLRMFVVGVFTLILYLILFK